MKRILFLQMLCVLSSAAYAEHENFGKTHFIIGQPSTQVDQSATIPTKALPQLHAHTCVLFSPDDDVRKALCTLIEREKEAIKVAMFMFTDKDIAQALIDAHKKGISVEIVADAGCLRERYNKISMLCDAGCTVFIYNGSDVNSLMHHKFVVFRKNDGDVAKVWTGSFNFTKAGREVNQENAIVSSDKTVVDQFEKQFEKLKRRSHKYGSGKIRQD